MLHRWLARAIEHGASTGEFRADIDPDREATRLVAFLDGVRLQWFYGALDSLADTVRDCVGDVIERISTPR